MHRIAVWLTVLCATLPLCLPAAGQMLVTEACMGACPQGSGTLANQVIVRPAYTLSNNPVTKFADWIAYTVDARNFGPSRTRTWKADPDLPESATLEPEDYRDAAAILKTDRGHQAPLASFAGMESWATTNYLSNITPQASALNQGPWVRLETAVRALATGMGGTVHVVTGPLYERPMPSLPGADEPHVVPSGYFKIVAIGRGRSVVAFTMDQDLDRAADFCATRVPIYELEVRVRLHFFAGREAIGDPAEAFAALGC
ncbi:DNA/RNA non-specific endonuclease [Thalassobaculum sp. OXR-137]|uniref:DNA/RNA non-specific endonuclease n=1 Tax=Thalassobaculum sp. OXR-137 TaxID=3100173 RepID=UPI002AC961E2|nr:DNA/RNA non-specific endonuclease [Thalassobaculum sp. OXR-137]WPZ35535.1 DNA/RNA non-specific endonuclease [Thalassobaculum sp. OXR-137]